MVNPGVTSSVRRETSMDSPIAGNRSPHGTSARGVPESEQVISVRGGPHQPRAFLRTVAAPWATELRLEAPGLLLVSEDSSLGLPCAAAVVQGHG